MNLPPNLFSPYQKTLCTWQRYSALMVNNRWTHANTTVYNIGHHLIWCPKYSEKFSSVTWRERLKELLFEKANEIDVSIESIEALPDHLHLFVKVSSSATPHWIAQQMKGYEPWTPQRVSQSEIEITNTMDSQLPRGVLWPYDRDMSESSTDTPQTATLRTIATVEPHRL